MNVTIIGWIVGILGWGVAYYLYTQLHKAQSALSIATTAAEAVKKAV